MPVERGREPGVRDDCDRERQRGDADNAPGRRTPTPRPLGEHDEGLLSVQPFHRTERPYERLSMFFNIVAMMGTDAFTPSTAARSAGASEAARLPVRMTAYRTSIPAAALLGGTYTIGRTGSRNPIVRISPTTPTISSHVF